MFYKIISESFKSSVAKFQATLENFELLGYTEQQKYLQRFANSLARKSKWIILKCTEQSTSYIEVCA